MSGEKPKVAVKLVIPEEANYPYGVLYGCLPWNDEGAEEFARFLNEEIWGKGYKLEQLNVELDSSGGMYVAVIWGIVRPKTIFDRILY